MDEVDNGVYCCPHDWNIRKGNYIIMTKKMDWTIWKKKVVVTALAVLVAGGVSVWADNPYWLALLPVLKGFENYWKHK